MNLTTVDDPIQRKFLPSFLRGVAEENKLITSPNFVVTQALVALLADKGARLKPACDKADVEKRGEKMQPGMFLELQERFQVVEGVCEHTAMSVCH